MLDKEYMDKLLDSRKYKKHVDNCLRMATKKHVVKEWTKAKKNTEVMIKKLEEELISENIFMKINKRLG